MAHVTKHNREEEWECDDGKRSYKVRRFFVTKAVLNVQASRRVQVPPNPEKKFIKALFLEIFKDH